MLDEQKETYAKCFVCGEWMDVWGSIMISRCTPCYRKQRAASFKAQPIPWSEWVSPEEWGKLC